MKTRFAVVVVAFWLVWAALALKPAPTPLELAASIPIPLELTGK